MQLKNVLKIKYTPTDCNELGCCTALCASLADLFTKEVSQRDRNQRNLLKSVIIP